jgi:ectoine hydroxylase-related dioxygenase (phytanoyl-CoA dioxygenase family)
MELLVDHKSEITENGFTVLNNVYTNEEVKAIITEIDKADQSNLTFRKSADLFAIRRFLIEVPSVKSLIFNSKLRSIIRALFGSDYFVVKSIYFDKPEKSNWFVSWHQDLTLAVNKKADIPGYGPWTTKLDVFAVQPPIDILQTNFTIRIHLDNTDDGNGALKVISGSHDKVYRPENIDWQIEKETTCEVNAGGIMIMRPLLMHSSSRSTTSNRRRVVHIEFSKEILQQEIDWAEKGAY